jgi:hypothetical protein
LRRHYRGDDVPDDEQWVAPLATALQQAHLVYLVGALFVGIAFQPLILMLIGVEIGFDTYLSRRRKEQGWKPLDQMVAEPGTPKLAPLPGQER